MFLEINRSRNQSVQKAFALLGSFRNSNECLTGAELSRRAQMPRATAHRIIQTLEEIGVVKRDGGEEGYRLGVILPRSRKKSRPMQS